MGKFLYTLRLRINNVRTWLSLDHLCVWQHEYCEEKMKSELRLLILYSFTLKVSFYVYLSGFFCIKQRPYLQLVPVWSGFYFYRFAQKAFV